MENRLISASKSATTTFVFENVHAAINCGVQPFLEFRISLRPLKDRGATDDAFFAGRADVTAIEDNGFEKRRFVFWCST